MTDLKKHVIDEFNSKTSQEMYIQKAEDGLWESEEVLIKKYFKEGKSILDIGCGTGRTTIGLKKLDYKVRGLDITPNMIKNAKSIAKKKKLLIPYEVGDACNLKFRDNSFDYALFSNNGWTQIPGKENRAKALEEILRILKPNGIFIFTAHYRRYKGFTWWGLKQFISHYVLKPVGFNVVGTEFGDMLFDRENSGTIYKQKQYIHIPSVNGVKNAIQKSGFDLILCEYNNKLSSEKNKTPVYYVCKKA